MPHRLRLAVLQRHLAKSDPDTTATSSNCRAASAPSPPVLIGGMVMDVQAHPTGPADVLRGGSVPGRVVQSAGGVARNIAESLALLCKGSAGGSGAAGELPLLVSVVGDDLPGRALLAHCTALGLSTGGVAVAPGAGTPMVAVVFDRGGEVAACVADVALLEAYLTPGLLRQRFAPAIAAAPLVVLDGNLSAAAIEEACSIAAGAGRPVWFEPVSASKAVRATRMLGTLAFVSPNQAELVAMAEAQWAQQQQQQDGGGRPSSSSRSSSSSSSSSRNGMQPPDSLAGHSTSPAEEQLQALRPHLSAVLWAGTRHVVLTLGGQGAALCTLSEDRRWVEATLLPAAPAAAVVNCSGAGDALVAGACFGLLEGRPPAEALALGVAAAALAVQSTSNIPPGLSAGGLAAAAGAVLRAGRALRLRCEERA